MKSVRKKSSLDLIDILLPNQSQTEWVEKLLSNLNFEGCLVGCHFESDLILMCKREH